MGHWHPRHWALAIDPTASSTGHKILTAVQTIIRSKALDGIDDSSVLVKKLPLERVYKQDAALHLPGVLITPGAQAVVASSNVRDDITYDVLVTFVDADNQEPTLEANLDRYMLWRERVASAFRNQRLPGVESVYTCNVAMAETINVPAWLANLYSSAITLKFTSREMRG